MSAAQSVVACMGGWCNKRQECAHYWSKSTARSERLCERGKDEPMPMTANKFDAWLAGATEAQAERFRQLQGRGAVKVRDDELPPALRGGALEVF